MDILILTLVWAVVWAPDAHNAWQRLKASRRETTDLQEVRYVEDIRWSKK